MSPICRLINTTKLKFCLSSSKTQVQHFKKKSVSNNVTQDSLINVHNKTRFIYERMNYVPKYSSYDNPLPSILKLAILISDASSR